MPKLSPECLNAVREALQEYIYEVEGTLLTPSTQGTYTYHAINFVRWLDDDFVPGETKRGSRERVIEAVSAQMGRPLTEEEKDEVRHLPG